MTKFFKDSVTDKVKQLLIEYPPSRDSDQKLISLYYWKHCGHDIETMNAKTLLWLIYNSLREEPRTSVHFRNVLKIPHQTCTAMLSHLEDSGWIYKQETIRIDDKSYTLYNAETNKQKALQRALQVQEYKKNEWINRGLKNGWFDRETAHEISLKLDLF